MKLLLDTCCLIWIAAAPRKLSPRAREALENPSNHLTVSAISAFEVGLLHRSGRVRFNDTPEIWFDAVVAKFELTVIPVSAPIAMRSALLPAIHRDPVDRMLIATAGEIGAAIITPGSKIPLYPDMSVIW